MADDTLSKIKLRLNSNSRLIQSKSTRLAALNNRMSATDYSPCNDFFANCCNCCGPSCDCCRCLSGFYLTASGWKDALCTECEEFNGTWYIPLTIGNTNDPATTCGKLGDYSFQLASCNKYSNQITWVLSCVNGQLQLSITQDVQGQSEMGVDVLSGEAYNLDCDNLSGTILLENHGRIGLQCDPSEATLSFQAVFGSPNPNVSEECLCCPTRCGDLDVDCLNPIASVLNVTITDNCGTRTLSIVSDNTDPNLPNLTWSGTTTLNCCESENTILVQLSCINGGFVVDVSIFIPGEGYEVLFSYETDWECDPFTATAKPMPKCTTFGTISSDCQPYCITSLTIQE